MINENILKWTLSSELLNTLSSLGKVYFVGGYVRDAILNNEQHNDQDILITSVEIDRLLQILSNYGKAELVGKSFGIIKFRCYGRTYDFAVPSLRNADGSYPKPYLPLEEDLKGRDFTANAIAYDIVERRFVDPTDGLSDIKEKILRQTSRDSFKNDPLRILRMCRLAAKLKFRIERETQKSAKRHAEKIIGVANERVGDEFEKIMLLEKPSVAFRCLERTSVLRMIIPELQSCVGVTQPGGTHIHDVFEHILHTIDESPQDLLVRFAALFHDITKPRHRFIADDGRARFYGHQSSAARTAKKWLTKYSFSLRFANNVAKIVEYHMFTYAKTDKGVRRFIRRIGEELVEPIFQLRFADTKAQGLAENISEERRYYDRVKAILSEKPPLTVKALAVDGNDVMRILKIPPSPMVGKVLDKLLSIVINDPSANRRELLLQIITKIGEEFNETA